MWSLNVAGSLSSPLTTRYTGSALRGTDHLRPASKPAPPRPRKLAALTSSPRLSRRYGSALRRPAAGHALDLLEGELAVGGGRAGLDAQLLLGVLEQLVGAVEHAGDVRAERHEVTPDRLQEEHVVERRGAVHLRGCEVEQLGHMLDGLGSEPAVLLLGHVQDRHQCGARHGVERDQVPGALDVLSRQTGHYLSTSPIMGSIDEMMATASATKRPCIMCGIVWRFTNDGARMCTRYGRAEPSDTR